MAGGCIWRRITYPHDLIHGMTATEIAIECEVSLAAARCQMNR